MNIAFTMTLRACYYSVQIFFLSFRVPSKMVKIKTYKSIILPVVLYGCETCSFTFGEGGGHKLGGFRNTILR